MEEEVVYEDDVDTPMEKITIDGKSMNDIQAAASMSNKVPLNEVPNNGVPSNEVPNNEVVYKNNISMKNNTPNVVPNNNNNNNKLNNNVPMNELPEIPEEEEDEQEESYDETLTKPETVYLEKTLSSSQINHILSRVEPRVKKQYHFQFKNEEDDTALKMPWQKYN